MHDTAVADHARGARVQDAAGHQVQGVLLARGVVDCVPRVGAALARGRCVSHGGRGAPDGRVARRRAGKTPGGWGQHLAPGDDVEALGQHVHQLAFALVPPLGAQHWHTQGEGGGGVKTTQKRRRLRPGALTGGDLRQRRPVRVVAGCSNGDGGASGGGGWGQPGGVTPASRLGRRTRRAAARTALPVPDGMQAGGRACQGHVHGFPEGRPRARLPAWRHVAAREGLPPPRPPSARHVVHASAHRGLRAAVEHHLTAEEPEQRRRGVLWWRGCELDGLLFLNGSVPAHARLCAHRAVSRGARVREERLWGGAVGRCGTADGWAPSHTFPSPGRAAHPAWCHARCLHFWTGQLPPRAVPVHCGCVVPRRAP